MATGKSAAVSHVGKIRANNQDSGYAGRFLFVVADGMGGHAGGDVASAMRFVAIADATSPPACPPIPSATTNRCCPAYPES